MRNMKEGTRRLEILLVRSVVLNIANNPHGNMSLLLEELDMKALFHAQ